MEETAYDPADYSVDEVNEHLETVDPDEKNRILDVEREGKARVGIVGQPQPSEAEDDEEFAEVPSVEYVGRSDVRTISQEDWASVGTKQATTTWDTSNKFKVPVADLTKNALEFLSKDPSFKLPES